MKSKINESITLPHVNIWSEIRKFFGNKIYTMQIYEIQPISRCIFNITEFIIKNDN